jgi:hypothetical protein
VRLGWEDSLVNQDDPEKRIVELERQLAEQKRAAESERQRNVARQAGSQTHGGEQQPWLSPAHAAAIAEDQARRRKLNTENLIGWISIVVGGLLGIWGVGLALTVAVFPSTVMWMSEIVCDIPYHLEYSAGGNVVFECVSDERSYRVMEPVIGMQALLIALIVFVLAVVVAVCVVVWRRLGTRR